MTEIFVNREREQQQLLDLATAVAGGTGRAYCIEGPAGIGKTALLKAFQERAATIPGLRISKVTCHGQIGAENSYGPIIDLLALQPAPRSPRRWTRRRRIATDLAPDLLELVPVAGTALKLGAQLIKDVIEEHSEADPNGLIGQVGRVAQILAGALLRAVVVHGPTLLIIDDAERIDPSSCIVLDYLAQALPSTPLGLVLVHRDSVWAAGQHPLIGLLRTWRSHSLARAIRLEGLPDTAVGEYLRQQLNLSHDDAAVRGIQDLTAGHPLLLAQYVTLVRDRQAADNPEGRSPADMLTDPGLPERPLLDTVEAVLSERLALLDQATIRLLVIAATQGRFFLSAVVQEASGLSREEVLERLYEVEERGGLIQAVPGPEWAVDTRSDCYQFQHALVQRSLYARQSGQLRRDRHLAVAEAIDRLLRSLTDPPRDLLLDLGRHYHLGGAVQSAARHDYRMALDLARTGSSYAEVATLCSQAMNALQRLPSDGGENDRLRVSTLELLLVTSETHWEASDSDESGVLRLAVEAAEAADRVGDPPLQARAGFLYGKILLHARGGEASLNVLAQALARTGKESDPVNWFLIAAEYGAQLTQRDLVRGMAMMHEAEELLHRAPQLRDGQDAVVRLIADQLEQHLGINHLDAGDPHGAQVRLTAVLERLRARGATDQLQPPLNYLAQTRIALGDLMGAQELLDEAIGLTDRSGAADHPASAWHAYQVALLGHVALLRNDTETALERLRASADEVDRSGIVSIAPLVHNYLAEALLEAHPADDRRIAEAERLAAENAADCRRAGTARSEVVAWSLVARARLAQGRLQEALRTSAIAVAILEDSGGRLPAVSAEEIYYHHAKALSATGDQDGATRFLERAWQEIQYKAVSLTGPARRRFLEDVPINRSVAGALGHNA
ncbi:ATP-binding protein [Streptomyces sp. NPDC001269]